MITKIINSLYIVKTLFLKINNKLWNAIESHHISFTIFIPRNLYQPIFISFLLAGVLIPDEMFGQTATVIQESRTIRTYPYSDPNPLPSIAINNKVARFYPYYMFDGYTTKGEDQQWKVFELENPYIKVSILPEVGGKVMGAIEKSTGEDFVYLNHVLKFRAIGIRGPWTSGGIEHNFGLDLGHAPWTAAPVDYVVKENPDGSVSCTVGGLDLASRSQWRVNIVLPKDKAYFETNSLWYNPTPLHDAYLSWENAAFRASDDLQFYFPGTHYIGHDGSAYPWPVNQEGRDLSMYRNNDFGGHKSYHVMGTYTNWFGGYWHEKDFGFGHWAPYSDAPGKKIWIWSLARSGAIWEDLLTDSDGQYIEAQSGVKFNQAGEKSGFHSPFNQLSLRPYYADTKTEYWFPVKGTGGLTDVSPYGTLQVTPLKDGLKVTISPISLIIDSLRVYLNGEMVYAESLQLKPMQTYHTTIPISKSKTKDKDIRVVVGNEKLMYSSRREKIIDRPVVTSIDEAFQSAERSFRLGEDEYAMRSYKEARMHYEACLSEEPTHSGALIRMAELEYRRGKYARGLEFAKKVLETDTYHGGANYMYGILHRKLGHLTQAEEALSVAARTMEYRSGAYALMAGIYLQKEDFDQAVSYAQKALDYNRYNLRAYEILGTSYRKSGKTAQARKALEVLLDIDPLNHYARFELFLLQPTSDKLKNFNAGILNELPQETYLELAMTYINEGLDSEAKQVLEEAPEYPIVSYWLAYLNRDVSPEKSKIHLKQAEELSPEFVFPFRLETIPVLQWAQKQQPSWKNLYYLGLIHWSKGNISQAKGLFEKCGESPEYAPFYISRGILFQDEPARDNLVLQDFSKAKKLNPGEWRSWHYLIEYYSGTGNIKQTADEAEEAFTLFPNNPVTGLDYAKALLNTHKYQKSLDILRAIHILPQEGAREGHDIYEWVNLSLALDKIRDNDFLQALHYVDESRKWPEHLGAGKPFHPDTRLQDYLAAYSSHQLGRRDQASKFYDNIASYTLNPDHWNSENLLNNYLGILVLKQKGKQEEVNRIIQNWESRQDSLSNWNISPGSSSPEVRWMLAKYRNDDEEAEKYKNQIMAENKNNASIIFRALQLTAADH